MTEIKIKDNHTKEELRGKRFLADVEPLYATIRYSIREDGFQNKTRYVGYVVHPDFFDKV